MVDYVLIIGNKFPNVQVVCIGDSSNYNNLTWEGGDPLPDQATLDAAWLEHARDEMWTRIKVERERHKSGGVQITFTDADNVQQTKWIHSDDASRIQQIALVMLGDNIPAGLWWKTMDGTFILMTPALALKIFQTIIYYDQTNFNIAEQHHQAMLETADPYTYDYSGKWLDMYPQV